MHAVHAISSVMMTGRCAPYLLPHAHSADKTLFPQPEGGVHDESLKEATKMSAYSGGGVVEGLKQYPGTPTYWRSKAPPGGGDADDTTAQ